jgi:hypothetical protein
VRRSRNEGVLTGFWTVLHEWDYLRIPAVRKMPEPHVLFSSSERHLASSCEVETYLDGVLTWTNPFRAYLCSAACSQEGAHLFTSRCNAQHMMAGCRDRDLCQYLSIQPCHRKRGLLGLEEGFDIALLSACINAKTRQSASHISNHGWVSFPKSSFMQSSMRYQPPSRFIGQQSAGRCSSINSPYPSTQP